MERLERHGRWGGWARRRGGVVADVRLFSEKGRDCTIVNPWPAKHVTLERDGKPGETLQADRFTFKTHPGERLALTA